MKEKDKKNLQLVSSLYNLISENIILYSELYDNFSINNQEINYNIIEKYYFMREKSKKIHKKVKSLINSFDYFVEFYNTYEFIFKDDLVEAMKYWICLSKEEKQNFIKNLTKKNN